MRKLSLWLPGLAFVVWAVVWAITGTLPPHEIPGVPTGSIHNVHVELHHDCGTGRAFLGGTLRQVNGRVVTPVEVRLIGVECSRVIPAFAVIDLQVSAKVAPSGERASLVLFSESSDALPQVVTSAPAFMAWASGIRASLRNLCAALPGFGGALIPGLAVGDTGLIGADLEASMKVASLTHLMAVSGANCAVVIGLVYGMTALMGMGRWLRVVLSLAALALFVVIVTPEPSVVRASIMATIALIALSRGIPIAGLSALAGAVLISLAVDPWLAREYGFVLSVAATAALLTLSAPIARILARWMPHSLALACALPIAAQVACQPIIILLSPSIPVYGIGANLLAAPVAPLVTIIGLCAALLSDIPLVGELLVGMAWLPATWIGGVAEFVNAAPFAALPWPAGAGGFVLALACSAGIIVALSGRRTAGIVTAATATVIAFAISLGIPLVTRWTMPPHWTMAQCDVGQGDAVIVRDGAHIAVIDTGREPAALGQCLDALGITAIDLVVLTHFDADHVGGASRLVGRVAHVVHGPTADEGDDAVLDSFRAGGATVTQVWAGDTVNLGHLAFAVVWPARDIPVEPGNPASVTVAISDVACPERCLSALMLGDMPAAQQLTVMRRYPIARMEVVKVSHHGSRDNAPELYAAVHAAVALIGVGAHNGYGHPTAEAIDMVRSAGSTILRSDVDGLVLLSQNQTGGIEVWREKSH